MQGSVAVQGSLQLHDNDAFSRSPTPNSPTKQHEQTPSDLVPATLYSPAEAGSVTWGRDGGFQSAPVGEEQTHQLVEQNAQLQALLEAQASQLLEQVQYCP